MAITTTPQVLVCPHCEKTFSNNRVNGMALLEVANSIEARKQMHCRLTLNTLERQVDPAQWGAVKKAILDGYNDLTRDIHSILGFGTEAE